MIGQSLNSVLRSLTIFTALSTILCLTVRGEEHVRFAIAIHGGAGSNPDKWSQPEKDLRLAGLR